MNPYKPFLQSTLTAYAKTYRKEKRYTQENMAELLGIDVRSYSDLEHGIYCFSAVTLIFLLLLLTDAELQQLLSQLRKARQQAYESQLVGV